MNSFVDDGDAQAVTQPYFFKDINKAARSNSLSSSASVATNSRTAYSSAITFASTYSTSPAITKALPSPQLECLRDSMTVYYQYDENGKLRSSSADDPFVQQSAESFDPGNYLQRGDIVGAYLARREAGCTDSLNPGAYDSVGLGWEESWEEQKSRYGDQHTAGLRHEIGEEPDDSYRVQPDTSYRPSGNVGDMGFAAYSAHYHAYPNPEDIRHQHTLHGLLPYIHPARRLNALSGPAVDIIEEDTQTVLAHDIPKKLLVLFLGRNVVTKFIGTIGIREDNWFGGFQKIQKMFVPRGISSIAAIRILLAWLFRACRIQDLGTIQQFNVPHSLFAAVTLAQTLTMFGLHKDALRIDSVIPQDHLKRPIFADELEQIWNCFGPNNRYTYATIKVVGERLRNYELGGSRAFRKPHEMLELLGRRPALDALVRNASLNEQNRPVFSTEWCSPGERDGQRSRRMFNGYPARGPGRSLPSRPPALGNSAAREQDPVSVAAGIPKKKRTAAMLCILP
jgi:hypothetical protein